MSERKKGEQKQKKKVKTKKREREREEWKRRGTAHKRKKDAK